MFGFGMSAFAFDGICVPNPPPVWNAVAITTPRHKALR